MLCPLLVSISEYNLILPANQQSAPAKKTDPNTFHTTRRKSQRKNHPVNLPPHQLQKWRGGGNTLPRGQDATHTGQTATRPHGTAASARMPAKDTDRMGGNSGPLHGPPHPKGHPRGGKYCPPRPPKSTPKLEGKKLHQAGVRD